MTDSNGNKVTFSWVTSAFLLVILGMGGTGFALAWERGTAGVEAKAAVQVVAREIQLLRREQEAANERTDKALERIEAAINALRR